jgi:hypothetical protein
MTNPTPHPDIPTRAERQALNAALYTTGAETGFWDANGRPAPCPTTSTSGHPPPAARKTTPSSQVNSLTSFVRTRAKCSSLTA